MVVRLKITMPQAEYSALLNAAISELRDPESQACFFIREELKKRGLLSEQPSQQLTSATEGGGNA